jgi:hypothetical protein
MVVEPGRLGSEEVADGGALRERPMEAQPFPEVDGVELERPHGILEQPFDQRLRLVASGAVQHGAGEWAFPWLPRREEALDVFQGGLRLLALELGRKVPYQAHDEAVLRAAR